MYADILSDAGYKVKIAEDDEAALEKMKIGGFLDIIIPKIDGISVMKQLQITPPQTPNKCVLFLINLEKDEEIKTVLQLGNGYLIKSQITLADLAGEVKIYLDKYSPGSN